MELFQMLQMPLENALIEGLLYSFLALGLFITYRILNLADLTTEGSFTMGGAISAVFAYHGHPYLGVLLAVCGGILAGFTTAFLQTKLKIQPILAGILVMTGLYTINLYIMGRPTVSLLNKKTVFTPFTDILGSSRLSGGLTAALILALALIALLLFLRTNTGLSLRATGDNEDMVRASSINVDRMKFLGLGLGNALIALSGALTAQYTDSATTDMGIGIVVVGLASLIIGEAIFGGKKSITRNAVSAAGGSVLYRIVIALVMFISISPNDLKLISAIIVVATVAYPSLKKTKRTKKSVGSGEGDHA